MCMFCAAVPVVGAVGAKLNVEQNHKIALDEDTLASPKPIAVITASVVCLLLVGSLVYHTTMFGR